MGKYLGSCKSVLFAVLFVALSVFVIGAPRIEKRGGPINCSDKVRRVINVKDFIARRPSSAGDDTASIQSAFQALKNCSTLYFPAGTYRVGSPPRRSKVAKTFSIPEGLSGVTIAGAGQDNGGNYLSKIEFSTTGSNGNLSDDSLESSHAVIFASSGTDFAVRDLSLTYLYAKDGKAREIPMAGVWARRVSGLTLSNVLIKGFNGYGTVIGDSGLDARAFSSDAMIADSTFSDNRLGAVGVLNINRMVFDAVTFKQTIVAPGYVLGRFDIEGLANSRQVDVVIKSTRARTNLQGATIIDLPGDDGTGISKGDEVYGNSWGGDALYNIRVGYFGFEVSYRFVSSRTTPVNKIRYFNTYSLTKPGYHAGNGGKILIELQTDDGTAKHAPSGTVLTSANVPNPLALPTQLLVPFSAPAMLEAGKIYHIVFRNYDANPEENYVSVDLMYIEKDKNSAKPDQPNRNEVDMTTLARTKVDRKWKRFKENKTATPIFSLFNNAEVAYGGYGGMESWVREAKDIQGNSKVRQRFISSVARDLKSVSIRLGRKGEPKPLIVQLKDGTGKVLEEGKISTNDVSPVTPWSSFEVGHEWVTYRFKRTQHIEAGHQYYLELSAIPGDPYRIYPLRDGEQFGYASTWSNSYAEFTTQGANGWKGWDAWGNPNLPLGDLQMYFNEK